MAHLKATIAAFCAALLTQLPAWSQSDSLLRRSYSFVADSDPGLTSFNAAALTRFGSQTISEASLSVGGAKGTLADYSQSPDQREAAAVVESFSRLNSRTVVYGSIAYDNFSGKRMGGSAFINPGRQPFNIVDDSLGNEGRKHRDTYQLTGAVGTELFHCLSLGARLDYEAANSAKYKDLRNKNKLLDMTLTVGVYAPLGALSLGGALLYRRNTESLQFSTYGTSDKVYNSLVDYANFTGRIEQFGENGYTDRTREMPLTNNYRGFLLQTFLHLSSRLNLYGDFLTSRREGYYGRKSPYTITFTSHTSDTYDCHARIDYTAAPSLATRRYHIHRLDATLSAEKLQNQANTYQQLTNESGAYYYQYYDPLKTADKLWIQTHIAYTALLGIERELPTLTLSAQVDLFHRHQTAYLYPYLRRQRIGSSRFTLSAERNVLLKHSLITAALTASYMKGHGQPYTDQTLAEPSDKQTPPPGMDALLWREYRFLTSTQRSIQASVRYSFLPTSLQMKTFMQLTLAHSKAAHAHGLASHADDRTVLTLTLGATF